MVQLLGIGLLIVSAVMVFVFWLSGMFSIIDGDEKCLKTSGIGITISLIVCFFCIGGCIAKDFQPKIAEDKPFKTEYIYSLADNNLTNRQGYYRRVRIDTDMYYQYMYKSGSGYKHNKVKADSATVFEDDTTPRVEFYNVSQKWFIFENKYTTYKIYVPKATITQDYNVDLE